MNPLDLNNLPALSVHVLMTHPNFQDIYGQTIAADSSSSLQMYSALNGERVNDPSISFIGSIFSGFQAGRALFTIGQSNPVVTQPDFCALVIIVSFCNVN